MSSCLEVLGICKKAIFLLYARYSFCIYTKFSKENFEFRQDNGLREKLMVALKLSDSKNVKEILILNLYIIYVQND